MSKKALVDEIADKFSSKAAAETAIDAVFEGIEKVVRGGQDVQLRGFGSFIAKQRAGGERRNPQTGETIMVQPKKVLALRTKIVL